MGDLFLEYIISHKKQSKDYRIIAGIILGALLLLTACLLWFPVWLPLTLFLAVWGSYRLISARNLEYEYSFADGVLTIDKIVARQYRRRLIPIQISAIKGFGKQGDEAYGAAIAEGLQILDFTSGRREGETYYMIVSRPKATYLILLELQDALLEKLPAYLPISFR